MCKRVHYVRMLFCECCARDLENMKTRFMFKEAISAGARLILKVLH